MSDQTYTVVADEAGERLDRFLASPARLGSRGRASDALAKGKVFLNDDEVDGRSGARRVVAGDRVRVWMDRPGSSRVRAVSPAGSALQIVFEDATLLVADKPPGLLTVPLPRKHEEPALSDLVELHLRSQGKRRPEVVHRIDRDTSGLVVFAKTTEAAEALIEQFARREPTRVYLAVVLGHPDPPAGTWTDRVVWDRDALVQKRASHRDPRGVDATSTYRVQERFDDASLIEVRLVTGKRNQIRIQAGLRGHPLLGEERYVYGGDDAETGAITRQALHAFQLAFVHPGTGRRVEFEAPMPRDMRRLIARLRKGKRERGGQGE